MTSANLKNWQTRKLLNSRTALVLHNEFSALCVFSQKLFVIARFHCNNCEMCLINIEVHEWGVTVLWGDEVRCSAEEKGYYIGSLKTFELAVFLNWFQDFDKTILPITQIILLINVTLFFFFSIELDTVTQHACVACVRPRMVSKVGWTC